MHLDRESCYRALLARDARFDGRFFTAVRTTGIFCRPICPARTPKLDNVLFLPSAAAALEAGFRPCLRCRPETSPRSGAWHGTGGTVNRAVALIEAGALDDADEEALAARLGLGARQLRRLFRAHLGASPGAVARARRFLFAKHLVTETRLPLTEVALASGFGSVRRFNEAFRTAFGRAPTAARRGGAETGPGVVLTLPYVPPYAWPAMIGFLAARAIPGVEQVGPERYGRTISLGGAHGTIEVRPIAGAHALRATIVFPVITALPAIVERIRRLFDLGADPAIIGAHLSADPLLAGLVAARPGLRVPGAWDGFELAVRGIVGQQITVVGATRLLGRLATEHGTALPGGTGALVFPTPERIAGAVIGGMPGARAAALSAMARQAIADPALFTPGRDLAEAVARLTALPGIGAWTAHYIAMRALREPDAFPAADVALLRAASSGLRRRSARDLLAMAEAWRPWRAYAAMHLWTSLTEVALAAAA